MSLPTSLLSVIVVVRNRAATVYHELGALAAYLARGKSAYELVVVDNASGDGSSRVLEQLTESGNLVQLQVYALEACVEHEAAAWVGVERAAGDAVAVLELAAGASEALDVMLPLLEGGVDFVSAAPQPAAPMRWPARPAGTIVRDLIVGAAGRRQSRSYLLHRHVVNALARQPNPAAALRALSTSETFHSTRVTYAALAPVLPTPSLFAALDDGVRVTVSRSRKPLRLVTMACAFGALGNLMYLAYAVVVALLGRTPAPGWTSTALQQAGTAFILATGGATVTAYLTHIFVPALRPRLPVVRAAYASASADVDDALEMPHAVLCQRSVSQPPSQPPPWAH